jgi:hypothetical protein
MAKTPIPPSSKRSATASELLRHLKTARVRLQDLHDKARGRTKRLRTR